jgi:hypothetical protein
MLKRRRIDCIDLLYHNWLRVSLKRKRDVKERCSVGVQERFESC